MLEKVSDNCTKVSAPTGKEMKQTLVNESWIRSNNIGSEGLFVSDRIIFLVREQLGALKTSY